MIRILLLILFIQPAVESSLLSDEAEILRQGRELEENGQYEQALQTWAKALTELNTPSLTIGRAYIRLATEQNIDSYYQTASMLYKWGLSAKQIPPNKKALSEELPMLEPLVDDNTFDQWQQLLEDGNPALNQELKQFWQTRDPTLTTTYNERLIEHWERIAYAREQFTRDKNPPYGTDDRGTYWVRYGTPDRKFEGRLKATRGQVKTVCSILSCNSEIMGNAVFQLHQRPYYDIWIYDKPNQNMEYNLVLIFGEDPTSGFGRVEIVEDFIPDRAFTFSSRYNSPSLLTNSAGRASDVMTPGMVMQWLYYKQLATKDPYFADRYTDMHFKWDRVGPSSYLDKSAGHVQAQQTRTATMKNIKTAPEEISTYERTLSSIPLDIYQYRLLNERNQLIYATFLESNPQQVFVNDLAMNQDSMFNADSVTLGQTFDYYELYHGLQIRNDDGEVISQSRVPTPLALDSTNTEPSTSVFKVPLLAGDHSARLYAELHNRHPNSEPRIQSPFPKSLRGQGKIQLEQPEPLLASSENLQMGDLILGYQMQDDSTNTLFPFVVANDKKIPTNENLVVHLEVYHLQQGPDGLSRFQLSYQILPVNFLGWTQEKKDEVSLTLNLETTKTRYVEDLEIQTEVLQPGKYVLRMQAKDQENEQEIQREIEFEVTK